MFKENWLMELKGKIKETKCSFNPPQTHENHIIQIVETHVDTAIKRITSGQDAERVKADIYKDLRAAKTAIKDVTSQYNKLYRFYTQISDIRKQEILADYHERMRYLVFRILTAIGIAAVVLGTGYLAHTWQIPLPLLRLPTG